MSFDYVADDRRLISAAGASATWGCVCAVELFRKRFGKLFAISGFASAFLAYEANEQLKAHKAYFRAKQEHVSIRDQKIALIAQTQKVVPISDQDQMDQINKIRKLLDAGLVPYIVTVNNLHAFRSHTGNDVKLVWVRSESFDMMDFRNRLAKEFHTETPLVIEKHLEDYTITHCSSNAPITHLGGNGALDNVFSMLENKF